VLEDVKRLAPDGRQRLRAMLDSLPNTVEADEAELRRREAEFERRLLEKGIVTRIPPPITDSSSYEDWEPIEIEGKPLSETIIEERR
jgi:hypothetical protein